MEFDQELYALTIAIKRNNFKDLDIKGNLLYKGSDSFKHLKQSVIKLRKSLDVSSLNELVLCENIELVKKSLKNHSEIYKKIVHNIPTSEGEKLEFLLTFWFLIITKEFTGNQLIRIIKSQSLNIQEHFQNQLIWTLSKYVDKIFYKEEIKFGTDIQNIPTYTITDYDFFMAFLKRLIEEKYDEIYQNKKR
ncbi:MAG: hypothetical protein ACTSPQ_20475 [Candidatus Helarchaeota archaeon]